MKPVVSSVHHAAQDGLADDQLPEEFPRLPGKRLVLSSLRKLVVGAPVVHIVRDCFALLTGFCQDLTLRALAR